MTEQSSGVWELSGDELVVRNDDGTPRRIAAESLFRHVFRDANPDLPDVRDGSARSLSFAKVPLTLWLEVGFFGGAEGPSCRVIAEESGAGVRIIIGSVQGRRSDHAVVDGTWYPFTRGALEEIRAVLLRTGLQEPGPVTLRQYLDLKRNGGVLVRFPEGDGAEVRLGAAAESAPVRAELYEYQKRGVGWLKALTRERMGGVLADEMGLGKTLQVIALLASEADLRPALIVAPATLLENWRRELLRFAPSLSCDVHHGSGRTGFPAELRQADIVITSYETVVRDLSLLRMITWGGVVLDEAQNIRNPGASRTAAVKGLPRQVGIAVTGTPIENTIRDLWSICDFAVPGLLGDMESFLEEYENTPVDASRLAPITGPFVLRRLVADVAADLPERIDVPQPLVLPEWMASEYDGVRRSVAAEYGPTAGFAGLVRLRQYCTHPFLLAGRNGDPAAFSPKYARLTELLEEIAAAREKALIFTSFTEMNDILAWDLPRRFGLPVLQLDGRTPVAERQSIVDGFAAEGGSGVLVLNPQAGGTGLNITAANHVIHYNPEWNPATQDQASARAHRRGQTRPVTIHQLYYLGTIEEVMIDRLQRKRDIAGSAVAPESEAADRADIRAALERSPFSTERVSA